MVSGTCINYYTNTCNKKNYICLVIMVIGDSDF